MATGREAGDSGPSVGVGGTPPNARTPTRVIGHPQHIAPSAAKRDDAKLIAPFVREKHMRELDIDLRIGGRVSPDVLLHVLQNHVDPLMRRARMTYKSAEDGELNARAVLSHLFPIFWSMVPRDEAGAESSDEDGAEPFETDDHLDLEIHDPLGSQTEILLSQSEADSFQSLIAQHEDRSLLGDRGALDFSFRSRLVSNLEWVWRLLLDAKDMKIGKTNHWRDVVTWQLLSYANFYAVANTKVPKYGVLHLAAMQIGLFAFSQLHVYGAVEVKDGKISELAFDAYKEQEAAAVKEITKKSRCAFYYLPSWSHSDLVKQLEDAQKLIRAKRPGAKILDGWYIVGDLYIEDTPICWDRFAEIMPSLVPGSMFVMEYLLETLIGRKVRKWTIDTVDQMVDQNAKRLSGDRYYQANHDVSIEAYKKLLKEMHRQPSQRKRRKI